MFCDNCGSQIKEGLNFCTVCGAAIEAEQGESIPVAKQVATQQQTAQFNEEELALIYVKEYEDMAILVLVLSVLALCLPFPLIRFVLAIIASSKKSQSKSLPLRQIRLKDINLIVRAQSAKRKIKVASSLISLAFVLMFVPVILLIIAAVIAFGVIGISF